MVNCRRLFFIVPLVLAVLAPVTAQFQVPDHRGAVNDLANVISPGMAKQIENLAIILHRETGFSMVFLTINKLPEDVSIEEYAVKVYEKWGIGAKGKDHGVLTVAAIQDRRMRIEAGYGAEGYLPDAVCKIIIEQHMAPAFKAGNYDKGFAGAANEITSRAAKEFNLDLAMLSKELRSSQNRHYRRGGDASFPRSRALSPVQMIVFGAILLLLMATPFGRQILFVMLLSSLMGGGRRGGGGFGGGFSSGGGFGGGMSGGGGASGSW